MNLTLRDLPQFPPPWAYASATTESSDSASGVRRQRSDMRRAFGELRLAFLRAAAEAAGPFGDQLRQRVQQAGEPIELWLMHPSVLAALPEASVERHDQAMRAAFARVMDDQAARR